jgi:hypothetical protein
MYPEAALQEYLVEIRKQVCMRCIGRPPGGPPCAPLGMQCGVELYLPLFLEAIHQVDSPSMEPYEDTLRRRVCSQCVNQNARGFCLARVERTCPLNYLFPLVVQAVETVDERHERVPIHSGV